MEYVFKEKISINQYEEFMKNQKYLSYMQEEMWSKVKGTLNHRIVAVLKNKKVCALAHIIIRKRKGKNIFFIPNGYLIDYSNEELLNFFTNNIKEMAKKYNAYVIDIYPNINQNSQEHAVAHDNLIKLNYIHDNYYFENTKNVLISLKEDNKKINLKELKEKYENKDFYLKRGIYFEISENLEDIKRLEKLVNKKYFNKEVIGRLMTYYKGRIKIIFSCLDLVFYLNYLKENTKEYDEINKIEELLEINDNMDIGCALVIEPYNKKESICELVYNTEKESFDKLEITNGLIYETMKICHKNSYDYIKVSNIDLNIPYFIDKFDAIPYKYIGKYSLVINKMTYFFNKEIHIKKR